MKKYIIGEINGIKFETDEPLGVKYEIRKITDIQDKALITEMVRWTWDVLIKSDTIGETYDKNGVYLEVCAK